ncbi:hypothetical protein GWK47_012565 [Chionoecetes opilio]|uniref:DDE Tnp4 domain-containing protein n=1 Tax=Chionoecetes opilio TaxID=41210 RepID=A0A8J4Y180_CHIOP|nr:hypothetical protein GWK47_012565 [Chionoecetes opilio]
MSKDNFVKLLNLVSPLIRKQDTKLRKAVSPAQRLSVTLRYLATGESRRSLEFQYRISHNLISSIIPEVCDALFAVLRGTYLKLPTTSAEWQEVASGFSNVWQFPNCIGALDGKRFLVIKPDNSGAEYFDYKSHHSVIMLALVDASYKFLYIDVGAQGRASESGVWDKCNLKKYIEDKKLQTIEREDTDHGVVIPRQRQEAVGFERLQAPCRGHSNQAKVVRDNFKNYFMSNGKVEWQEKMALLH